MRITFLFAACALAVFAFPAAAEEKAEVQIVEPIKIWNGSVGGLGRSPPAVITSAGEWLVFWHRFHPRVEAPPVIDFSRNIVCPRYAPGSRMELQFRQSEEGDLKVRVITTADKVQGLRYIWAVIPREGIKSVNGKPLPER